MVRLTPSSALRLKENLSATATLPVSLPPSSLTSTPSQLRVFHRAWSIIKIEQTSEKTQCLLKSASTDPATLRTRSKYTTSTTPSTRVSTETLCPVTCRSLFLSILTSIGPTTIRNSSPSTLTLPAVSPSETSKSLLKVEWKLCLLDPVTPRTENTLLFPITSFAHLQRWQQAAMESLRSPLTESIMKDLVSHLSSKTLLTFSESHLRVVLKRLEVRLRLSVVDLNLPVSSTLRSETSSSSLSRESKFRPPPGTLTSILTPC